VKKLTILLAIILLGLLGERFVFRTARVEVEMSPSFLRANPTSQLSLKLIPINSLGFRTPFAHQKARFDIEEGSNLIELVQTIEYDHAIVRSKGIEGEATVGIYSLKSGMLLDRISIKIVNNDYAEQL
jgi:hypothetical protein